MPGRYYFKSQASAIFHHIGKRLDALGWDKAKSPGQAQFSDRNMALDEVAAHHLEHKHLLNSLAHRFCPNDVPLGYEITDDNIKKVLLEIEKTFYQDKSDPLNNQDLAWILKPALLNNGDHIKLFTRLGSIYQHFASPFRLGGPHILQKYIKDLDLYRGAKYSYRLFVILTNYRGILIYPKGYINICAVPFKPEDQLMTRRMHLTNFILDGIETNHEQLCTDDLKDFQQDYIQIKTILRALFKGFIQLHPDFFQKTSIPMFEILGIDFMRDRQKKMWLLECNHGPDFPRLITHPLWRSLHDPFWEAIMHDLVLPIGLGHPHSQNSNDRFQTLMSHRETQPALYRKAFFTLCNTFYNLSNRA